MSQTAQIFSFNTSNVRPKEMKHFELGASIYVPATHNNIRSIMHENKYLARSVIFCTEDSVNEEDIPKALQNLEEALQGLRYSDKTLKFIRVRNQDIFEKILQIPNIGQIHGFVFPKITADNFMSYFDKIQAAGFDNEQFLIMPTLETREVFCNEEMKKLRAILLEPEVKPSILSLRIGGNDLLNILGIRRSRHRTIYETPLGVTISNLVTIFKSYGFNLTAPVCELIDDPEILAREVPQDLEYGLFGKTAIHPDQINMIEQFYMPHRNEVEMAQAMLEPHAPAVFKMHGTMCEKATHSNWSKEILCRSSIYGIMGLGI